MHTAHKRYTPRVYIALVSREECAPGTYRTFVMRGHFSKETQQTYKVHINENSKLDKMK